MSNITEFDPVVESCIATITQPLGTGEMYSGPIHVGHYALDPDDLPECSEAFIEQDGARISVMAKNINALIKQLRRAQKMLESQ